MEQRRAALLIGHPGHELYVYGWMGLARPVACVLTDGTGLGRPSRVERTRRILVERHVRPGPIFGRWPDRQVYDWLLDGKFEEIVSVVHEFACLLAEQEIEVVVGDSLEGFNPVHDVCRMAIDAAVGLAEARLGRPLESYDFPQFVRPTSPDETPPETCWIQLDQATFQAKYETALGYPELAHEVSVDLERFGAGAFRSECLRPVAPNSRLRPPPRIPPVYELYGEALVRRGELTRAIRYEEHVRPLLQTLKSEVSRGT
jgi:hypothetical protein